MKKDNAGIYIFLLLAFVLFNGLLHAQKKDIHFYILNERGENIIKNDSISSFDEVRELKKTSLTTDNYLAAKRNNKYAIVDTLGNILTPFAYDEIRYFDKNVLSAVRQGKLWGFIDSDAELVVPYQYTYVYREGVDRCAVRDANAKEGNNLIGLLDITTGRELTPRIYNSIDLDKYYAKVSKNGKWGLIHKDGKEVMPLRYESISFYHSLEFPFTERLTICNADETRFLLDTLGNILNSGADFISDKAKSSLIIGGRFTGDKENLKGSLKYAFVNNKGKYVTPFIYDRAKTCLQGGIGKRGDVYCFVDSLGKEILCEESGYLSSKGDTLIAHTDTGQQYYNFKGEKIGYENVESGNDNRPEDYRKLDFDAKKFRFGYLDKYGKVVIPYIYRAADHFVGGRALVSKNGKTVGTIDVNNNVIIPLKLKVPGLTSTDKLCFKKDDRYIFSDLSGNQISAYSYESVGNISSFAYKGFRAGKWVILTGDGEEIGSCIYDEIGKGYERLKLVKVLRNNRVGLANYETGEEVVECHWHAIEVSEGYSVVHVRIGGKYGMLDVNGNVIIHPIYEEKLDVFRRENTLFIKAMMFGKYGLLDKNNEVLIPFKNMEITPFCNLFIVTTNSSY